MPACDNGKLMRMCLARVIAEKAQRKSPWRTCHEEEHFVSAAIAIGLAFAPLAPAAFADDMKKDTMSKDYMSKDSMKKDAMAKDKMSKDSMKKDDMSKDGMKK